MTPHLRCEKETSRRTHKKWGFLKVDGFAEIVRTCHLQQPKGKPRRKQNQTIHERYHSCLVMHNWKVVRKYGDQDRIWSSTQRNENTAQKHSENLANSSLEKSQKLTECPRLKGQPIWCPRLGRLHRTLMYWCIKSRTNQIFLEVGFSGVLGKEMCVSSTMSAIHHKEMPCYWYGFVYRLLTGCNTPEIPLSARLYLPAISY